MPSRMCRYLPSDSLLLNLSHAPRIVIARNDSPHHIRGNVIPKVQRDFETLRNPKQALPLPRVAKSEAKSGKLSTTPNGAVLSFRSGDNFNGRRFSEREIARACRLHLAYPGVRAKASTGTNSGSGCDGADGMATLGDTRLGVVDGEICKLTREEVGGMARRAFVQQTADLVPVYPCTRRILLSSWPCSKMPCCSPTGQPEATCMVDRSVDCSCTPQIRSDRFLTEESLCYCRASAYPCREHILIRDKRCTART
jgi:hypothetical protein